MSTTINNRIICNEVHANLDEYYGPYNSVEQALQTLGSETINGVNYNKRCVGLTIGVLSNGVITEYWFKNGTGDNDLVEKNTGGGGGLPGNLKVVTFDKNGATSGVQNSVITDTDGNIVLPEPTITKSGTTFSKWSYNGVQKNPGDVITIGSTTVVQAIWNNPTPTTYQLSWDNGIGIEGVTGFKKGEIPINSGEKHEVDTTIKLVADITKGYDEAIWKGLPSGVTPVIEGSDSIVEFSMPNNNLNINVSGTNVVKYYYCDVEEEIENMPIFNSLDNVQPGKGNTYEIEKNKNVAIYIISPDHYSVKYTIKGITSDMDLITAYTENLMPYYTDKQWVDGDGYVTGDLKDKCGETSKMYVLVNEEGIYNDEEILISIKDKE